MAFDSAFEPSIPEVGRSCVFPVEHIRAGIEDHLGCVLQLLVEQDADVEPLAFSLNLFLELLRDEGWQLLGSRGLLVIKQKSVLGHKLLIAKIELVLLTS